MGLFLAVVQYIYVYCCTTTLTISFASILQPFPKEDIYPNDDEEGTEMNIGESTNVGQSSASYASGLVANISNRQIGGSAIKFRTATRTG